MNSANRGGRMLLTISLLSCFSSTVQFRPAEEWTMSLLTTRESWGTAKPAVAIASRARSTPALYLSPIAIATAATMVPTRAASPRIIRTAAPTATAMEFQISATCCRIIWSRGNKWAGSTTARVMWYVKPNSSGNSWSMCRFACASMKPYSWTWSESVPGFSQDHIDDSEVVPSSLLTHALYLVSRALSQLLPFEEIASYICTCWHTPRLKVLNAV